MKSELHQLLKEWQPKAECDPAFRHKVWQRIAARQEARTGWLAWFEAQPLPRLAAAACFAAIVAGACLGLATGKADDSSEAAYLRAVNPYAALRS